jgi:hypothetical protein
MNTFVCPKCKKYAQIEYICTNPPQYGTRCLMCGYTKTEMQYCGKLEIPHTKNNTKVRKIKR